MHINALGLLIMVVTQCFSMESTELGAKYLQDTIKDLKMKTKHMLPHPQNNLLSPPALSIRRTYTPPTNHEPIPPPVVDVVTESTENVNIVADDKVDKAVPTLQLTKAELAKLYENALHKGETIKLDTGEGSTSHISAAVHELDNDRKGTDKDNGYYYYYYPLKSFVDELSSSVGYGHAQGNTGYIHENIKSQPYYNHPSYHHHHPIDNEHPHIHSHTHQYSQSQHNVHIEPVKPHTMMDADKKKGLEPLFMAISGFIGMTVMFILSILVLPKFNKLKPKGFNDDAMDFMNMGRVALLAIEGYDCTERFACEAGKTANAFNVYDNRFVKFLRRIAPLTVGKQIDKIGKYTAKRYKCAAIQCKRKVGDQKKT